MDIHTQAIDGITVVVSKRVVNHKIEYATKFGVLRSENGQPYFSPYIPAVTTESKMENLSYTFRDLVRAAASCIRADMEKDTKAEADRVMALSAKPGSTINVGNTPHARDKNGPRATGKTAKKRAKLAARAEAARKQP